LAVAAVFSAALKGEIEMTRTAVLSACIVAGIAGAAQAASVEFQIVERRGQVAWTGTAQPAGTNDAILNFSVLARVVGGLPGEALGNFGFDIVSNDGTGSGTFFKGSISNADGTYNTGATQYNNNATVGRGGLSTIYSYLAGINPNFNGLINTDGGSFVQNPAVEDLGLVTGSPTGGALLALADTQGTGNPDTYSGSGDSAPLDPQLAFDFLGADNHFVAVYNFNYVLSSNAIRAVTFSIANAQAQTFASLALANGVWGPANPVNATAVLANGATVLVTPAPGAAALLGLGGLLAARRRRN
jgi:MYXO-CTERM domain-containing protein